jgi:hypothetical protein
MGGLHDLGTESPGERLVGNTTAGVVTKMLTLVPILVAVYYFDLPKFLVAFTTLANLSYFLIAVSLFVLGVVLKRRILGVRLELSRISFTWGVFLLVIAFFLYVYGSYSADSLWYHYESLLVLAVGYVALRVGAGILRALSPLLAILALAFPAAGLVPTGVDQLLFFLLSADLSFILFLSFAGLRLKAMAISVAILILGFLGWYGSAALIPNGAVILVLLIPSPLLFLAIPRVRRFMYLPAASPAIAHPDHRILANGFCSICGLKVSRAKVSDNFGLWGLLAVLGVAALILFSSVPVLAIVNNVPYDAHYTTSSYTRAVTPATPSGWQVNSTFFYTNQNYSYAIRQVYVPLYHPETENYTMYYELSLLPLVSNGPSGGDIPDFNTTSTVDMQFGPFQGSLTVYSASGLVMLAYQGRTSMLFFTGSGFQEYNVGVGFVREFENTNMSSATSQFFGDLDALWLPAFTADVAYSSWASTLYALDQAALTLYPFLLLAASVMGMGWVAYRASRSDERLDRFLTLASAQPEEYWPYLSGLLNRSHRMGTGEELSLAAPGTQMPDAERVDSSLRELERRRLVRRSLVERGADIVSVWRPAV